MNLKHSVFLVVLLATMTLNMVWAQNQISPPNDPGSQQQTAPKEATSSSGPGDAKTTTPPGTLTIPAGTKVLMVLRSPLHTTSAMKGSAVYLETTFPAVAGNQVVIPAHTRVLGRVEAAGRPGRLRRNAQFRFRFTTLIFHNDYIVPIDGAVQSLPGSSTIRVQDQEGKLQPVDQAEKALVPVAVLTGAGGLLGSVGHLGERTVRGAALGAGLGLANVLLTRGDEIDLEDGTPVEMVLTRPSTVDLSQALDSSASAADNPAEEATHSLASTAQPFASGARSNSQPHRSHPAGRVSPGNVLRALLLGIL